MERDNVVVDSGAVQEEFWFSRDKVEGMSGVCVTPKGVVVRKMLDMDPRQGKHL